MLVIAIVMRHVCIKIDCTCNYTGIFASVICVTLEQLHIESPVYITKFHVFQITLKCYINQNLDVYQILYKL